MQKKCVSKKQQFLEEMKEKKCHFVKIAQIDTNRATELKYQSGSKLVRIGFGGKKGRSIINQRRTILIYVERINIFLKNYDLHF